MGCGDDEDKTAVKTPDGGKTTPTDAGGGVDAGGGDQPDGGDAGAVDAGPRCDITKPFQNLVEVAELNVTSTQGGARLTPDQLTVMFHAMFNGKSALFQATRTDPASPFGAPSLLEELATVDGGPVDGGTMVSSSSPTLSPDGKTLYFESFRGGRVQVWFATRGSTSQKFGAPALLPEIVDTENTGQPYLTGAGGALYFVSRDTGDGGTLGGTDIYRTDISAPGVGSGLVHEPDLNSIRDEYAPVVSEDGLEAFFSTKLGDDGGLSPTFRLRTSTRASKDAPWATPSQVPGLSTTGNDRPSWLSPDRCTLYLFSDGVGDAGGTSSRITRATRPK